MDENTRMVAKMSLNLDSLHKSMLAVLDASTTYYTIAPEFKPGFVLRIPASEVLPGWLVLCEQDLAELREKAPDMRLMDIAERIDKERRLKAIARRG